MSRKPVLYFTFIYFRPGWQAICYYQSIFYDICIVCISEETMSEVHPSHGTYLVTLSNKNGGQRTWNRTGLIHISQDSSSYPYFHISLSIVVHGMNRGWSEVRSWKIEIDNCLLLDWSTNQQYLTNNDHHVIVKYTDQN